MTTKIIKFFILGLLIFGFSAVAATPENISVAQFTTRVTNRMPVDNLQLLTTEFKKVYFYTDVANCSGCRIEHEWWFKGNKISTVGGKAKSNRYRWWSSKTLTNAALGDWTVKVVVDDDIVRTETLTYRKATATQRQTAPVQRRLEGHDDAECEIQLRYFSDKLKEHSEDSYFQFMMKKWAKRCGVE